VKIGGAALEDDRLRRRLSQDLTMLASVGVAVVVVHGGGKQITSMLERLGISSTFVRGQRVTDAASLPIVEMVLAGSVNKALVRDILAAGGAALGLSGCDAGLAKARIMDPELGLAGEVDEVDASVLTHLVARFIPVIAPLALDREGGILNVNADVFASRLAQALAAKKLLLLTDVAGVLDSSGRRLATLTRTQARSHLEAGAITGGMIPKVEHALAALAGGVNDVHILDGRTPHSLLWGLLAQGDTGTTFTADATSE